MTITWISCPSPLEWYSETAATIAFHVMASGIFTVLGVMPPILGSKKVTALAISGLKDVFGAGFAVEPDPVKAAGLITAHIMEKRKGLGLSVAKVFQSGDSSGGKTECKAVTERVASFGPDVHSSA